MRWMLHDLASLHPRRPHNHPRQNRLQGMQQRLQEPGQSFPKVVFEFGKVEAGTKCMMDEVALVQTEPAQHVQVPACQVHSAMQSVELATTTLRGQPDTPKTQPGSLGAPPGDWPADEANIQSTTTAMMLPTTTSQLGELEDF